MRRRHSQSLMLACCAEPQLLDTMTEVVELDTSAGSFTAPALKGMGDGRIYVSSTRSGIDGLFARVRGQPVVNGRIAGQRAFLERVLANDAERLVTLGQAGHEKLFPPAPPDPSIEDLVKTLIADDGDAVRLTAFEPASLPLVRVWDEHQRTLAALQRDEGSRNIVSGVLRLARQVLTEESSGPRSILYVNTSSTVWAQLMQAMPPRQRAIAGVLKSLVVLLDEGAGTEREAALAQALEQTMAALVSLCGEAT